MSLQKYFKILLTSAPCFFYCLAGDAQVMYVTQYNDADLVVYVTEYKSDADLVVYKTTYPSEAKGDQGLWFFTKQKSDAGKSIRFTRYRSQADLVVYYTNFKSDAGWANKKKNCK